MTEPMERELEELLYQMGIYLVQSGYGIVAEAARLAVEEPGRLKSLMQEFYPEVGARCNCAWSCVERSIRGTATRAWERTQSCCPAWRAGKSPNRRQQGISSAFCATA